MFARAIFAAMLAAGALALTGNAASSRWRPAAAPPRELAVACTGKDGWSDPGPPAKIDGRVYHVGTCGITVLLIASPAGHVLIDSGPAEAADLVLANIRRLGLSPRAIKWILASHSHFDHVGGLARLKAATGARVAALPVQARELASGEPQRDDPQFGAIKGFAPIKVDRILPDGVPLLIGGNRVTGFATPGHTAGSTTWLVRGCGHRACPALVYADSTSAISAEGYRFADHPLWVAMFRQGVARIGTLPCTILITPHPGGSQLFERLAGQGLLIDPGHCQRYADQALRQFDARLERELYQSSAAVTRLEIPKRAGL